MTKKQVGTVFFYILLGFPILVFMLTPAHAVEPWAVSFDRFLDNYLFGNGYFKPNRYPFSEKVTNSFTVVLAVFLGLLFGMAYWKEPDNFPEKDRTKVYIGMFILASFMLWLSIFPQEFSTSGGRNFGLNRSFHNNPASFLFLIFSKQMIIYGGVGYSVFLLPDIFVEAIMSVRIRNRRIDI